MSDISSQGSNEVRERQPVLSSEARDFLESAFAYYESDPDLTGGEEQIARFLQNFKQMDPESLTVAKDWLKSHSSDSDFNNKIVSYMEGNSEVKQEASTYADVINSLLQSISGESGVFLGNETGPVTRALGAILENLNGWLQSRDIEGLKAFLSQHDSLHANFAKSSLKGGYEALVNSIDETEEKLATDVTSAPARVIPAFPPNMGASVLGQTVGDGATRNLVAESAGALPVDQNRVGAVQQTVPVKKEESAEDGWTVKDANGGVADASEGNLQHDLDIITHPEAVPENPESLAQAKIAPSAPDLSVETNSNIQYPITKQIPISNNQESLSLTRPGLAEHEAMAPAPGQVSSQEAEVNEGHDVPVRINPEQVSAPPVTPGPVAPEAGGNQAITPPPVSDIKQMPQANRQEVHRNILSAMTGAVAGFLKGKNTDSAAIKGLHETVHGERKKLTNEQEELEQAA